MKPRKFVYEENGFDGCFLIEWKNNRLELQASSPCIPFLVEPNEFMVPSQIQWAQFRKAIESWDLKIIDQKDTDTHKKCFETSSVKCWITFEKQLLKFELESDNFEHHTSLRKAVNHLTVCEKYDLGFLFSNHDEE